MAKKNPIKKIFESASIESADVNPNLPESMQDQPRETPEPDLAEEEMQTSGGDEASVGEDEATSSAAADIPESRVTAQEEVSLSDLVAESQLPEGEEHSAAQDDADDDLLEDVRRTLIEEEANKEQKQSKWWHRIGRRGKSSEPESPTPPAPVEIDLPETAEVDELVKTEEQQPESDEGLLDELIDSLSETKEEAPQAAIVQEVPAEVPAEPEPEIDFEQLKEQALGPRPAAEEPEELSSVRSIALEGGEEVFIEVQPQATDQLDERLKGFENALRPYRSYIYTAIALLGLGIAVVASLIIYNVYKQSNQPVVQPSNLPFPTSVSLPGGWSFKLGKGSLQDGKWEPRGAEWLQGTEVCRWVALPWSRQLEAVIRTLNSKDPIDLFMSNNDKLTYEVYSVRQLSPEEMQKLDSNSPCLLLILTQPDSEKRWVLTALP